MIAESASQGDQCMVFGEATEEPGPASAMKTKPNPQIVAAAIIEKNGSVLIGKRKRGKRHIGNWEFPGGTLEEGETDEQCLKRELLEELGIAAEVGPLFYRSEHNYEPGWTVRLLVYRTTLLSGEVTLHAYDEVRWINPERLQDYSFSAAAKSIVEKLATEGHE